MKKRRLRGGRREGVDLIVVDNGALRFSIVPTRGMGLWNGWYEGNRLGWDSPITDGPINPSLVNLAAAGGLGWLDGFDELLARCGLENNGAPFEVKTVKPDGSESHATFGLHGKIANIPASYVAVHVGAEPPHEITVEGHVEESRLFGPQIRMETRITTVPGSNFLVVRDEFVNLKEQPVEMQILYHWNFGPPFLDAGARFLAPIKSVTPRDREGTARPGSTRSLRRSRARVFRTGLLLRAARPLGQRAADTRHAPQPCRRQGGGPAIPERPASCVHSLEEHGRIARRLRDRSGTGHELSQRSSVRTGPQPSRAAAGRRPLRRGDDPRSAGIVRGRRRGRGRDQAAPSPRRGEGQSPAGGAVCPGGVTALTAKDLRQNATAPFSETLRLRR